MIIEGIVLAVVLVAILSVLVHTLATGAPPTPTSGPVRAAVMKLLPESIDGPAFELGAGWGSLAVPLARRYPKNRVIAFERSPVPWMMCWLRKALGGPTNLRVQRADFMKAPLSEAALVVCYLGPKGTQAVKAKLEAELKPGCLVLSHTFAIRGWTPVTELTAGDIYRSPVYLYRIWNV